MKSKLTLRIDEDVKESAKALARQRGESVSGMVETYFRILTQQMDADERKGGKQGALPAGELRDDDILGPVTRRIAGALAAEGESFHGDDPADDRKAAIRAALDKHA